MPPAMSRPQPAPLPARPGEFDLVVLPLRSSVLGFAIRLSGDRHLAEDLVQDTYLRAWRSFATFTPGSDCRAWLFRICRNRFYDICRQRSRRLRPEELSLIRPVFEEVDLEVRAELVRRLRGEPHDPELLSDELNAALAEVPEDFLRPILLHDLEEMPYREIAELIGVPIGTIRSRIARGRRILRDLLLDGPLGVRHAA
ncbi:MAG: sigma-70 family RNA polymerase sigma factor [Planctomycetota bacterium]